MNRELFLSNLRTELAGLSEGEIENALQYYTEYFEDAGKENEARVLEAIGSPAALAAQIKADFAVRDIEAGKVSAKKGISAIWLVLLAIFASPIALPLIIAVGIVGIALVIAALGVLLSFFVAGLGLFIGAIGCIIISAVLIVKDPLTALFMLGMGLTSLGFALLLGLGVTKLSRLTFRGIARALSRILHRRRGLPAGEGVYPFSASGEPEASPKPAPPLALPKTGEVSLTEPEKQEKGAMDND